MEYQEGVKIKYLLNMNTINGIKNTQLDLYTEL
jgi:hypothetical protein